MQSGPRGRIHLIAEKCTSCLICVRECPDWCIELDSHQEIVQEGPRGKRVNVLDRFEIDWGACMYCGICVEVCPFDALEWAADADFPATTAEGLRHGIDDLAPDVLPSYSRESGLATD